jgi:predicted PurR-regulated permease PerM
MDKDIVVSLKTIVQAIFIGIGLYLVYRLGRILGLIFISLLIAISVEHTIKYLSQREVFKRTLGRPISVLITYLSVFLLGALIVTIGSGPVIAQSQKLIQTLLNNQELFTFGNKLEFSLSEIVQSFLATSGGVFNATRSIFNNVAAIGSVFITAIYMSLDWENIKSKFVLLFKEENREQVERVIVDVENNTGVWLKGQLFLMFVIGLLSYIGLKIVGVQFALALAIISGTLEIIPILGPIISAVVAGLVAVVDSPVKALLIVGVFSLIQNLEGNLLVPKVMGKVSGMSPLIILISLWIGSSLFGIIGAIVAVPVLMIATVIVRSLLEGRE